MIVLDASALVELVLATPLGLSVADRISDPGRGLNVPHLADLEVAQALRRFVREGALDQRTAETALADFGALDIDRHAHEPVLARIWQLRENLTAYDAAYVALAEVLGAVLLTADARLARAPGIACDVELVE